MVLMTNSIVTSKNSGTRDSILSALAPKDDAPYYLFSQEKITKENCKLCTHDCREEVEKLYEDQKVKNISAIYKILTETRHMDISYPAVRNHLLYHYQVVKSNVDLAEYAEDLQQWVDKQRDKSHAVRSRIAILEKEMVTIAESSQGLDLVERRRNAEIIKKLAETIMALEGKLEDSMEKMKPVTIVFKQLQIIIDDELSQSQSTTARKVLTNVFERLRDSIGDMPLDEE
jgi:ABC-type Na+ transport system ATPase subunit NatA